MDEIDFLILSGLGRPFVTGQACVYIRVCLVVFQEIYQILLSNRSLAGSLRTNPHLLGSAARVEHPHRNTRDPR